MVKQVVKQNQKAQSFKWSKSIRHTRTSVSVKTMITDWVNKTISGMKVNTLNATVAINIT